MIIQYATQDDEQQILQIDKHISQEQLSKAITDKRVYVAKVENIVLGLARYSLFWESLPFLNLIYVLDDYINRGVGSELLSFWENDMKKQGHTMLLTSTQTNELGQHFFRKRGFQDCGNLLLPNETLELILLKQIPRS